MTPRKTPAEETAELRAAIREAHELLQAFKENRRQTEKDINDLIKVDREIQHRIGGEIRAEIAAYLSEQLSSAAEAIGREFEEAAKRLNVRFEEIAARWLTDMIVSLQGLGFRTVTPPPLPELAKMVAGQQDPGLDVHRMKGSHTCSPRT